MACLRLTADRAAAVLQDGGVLLLATDTLPGLHARADSPEALARIAAAKGRPDGKPLLVIAGSPAQALLVTGRLAGWQEELCRDCWPGPFSLILPARPGLAAAVTGPGGTVAVRVPDAPELCGLVDAVGHPVASTSANAAGEPAAADMAAAVALLGDRVDGWWTPAADEGDAPAGGPAQPSALVDATVRPPRILRPGPRPLPGGSS